MSGPHEPEGLPASPAAMEAEPSQLRAANRELVRINERLAAAVEQRTTAMLRARDAQAQFLADVNREIRSPLNAILGYSEMLARDRGWGAGGGIRRHADCGDEPNRRAGGRWPRRVREGRARAAALSQRRADPGDQ